MVQNPFLASVAQVCVGEWIYSKYGVSGLNENALVVNPLGWHELRWGQHCCFPAVRVFFACSLRAIGSHRVSILSVGTFCG